MEAIPATGVTDYTYNAEKNRIESVGSTAFTHDPEGQLADKGNKEYTFDSADNMVSKTDPNGQTTIFQYDNMRRFKQTPAPAPFNYITKYEYDPNGNLTKFQRRTDDPAYPWQTTDIRCRKHTPINLPAINLSASL